MMERLAAAKPGGSVWDVKSGPGGLRNIELFAQAAALVAGEDERGLQAQIAATQHLGLDTSGRQILLDAAYLQRQVLSVARLVHAGDLTAVDQWSAGARSVLCQATGRATLEDLETRLEALRRQAADRISRGLASGNAASILPEKDEESPDEG